MSDIFDLVDTWNAGGTTFTAIKMNVTDTASASDSLLLDLQVGGVSLFSATKEGDGFFSGTVGGDTLTTNTIGSAAAPSIGIGAADVGLYRSGDTLYYATSGSANRFGFGNNGVELTPAGALTWSGTTSQANAAKDLILARDAADTLALRRIGDNPQTFNIYNTTDGTNKEFLSMGWGSDVFTISTESGGTGTARALALYASAVSLDGPADGSYTLKRGGVTQITSGSAGPRFNSSPYPGATIVDIGLGAFPFRDIFLKPSSSLTPAANGDFCIEATDNSTLTFKHKGSDGTVRSGTIALT